MPLFLFAQQRTGIQFEKGVSFQTIKLQAKKDHKLIFFDVYATWCGPCKQMDSEVYSQPEVGLQLNKDFISAKVQIDSTKVDEPEIRKLYADANQIRVKYNITSLPTYLFLDENGNLLHRGEGKKSVTEFVQMVQVASDLKKNYAAQIASFRNGNRDYLSLIDLYKGVVKNKNVPLADSIANALRLSYFDNLNDSDLLSEKNLDLVNDLAKYWTSHDKIFILSLSKPGIVDSAYKKGSMAQNVVASVIAREEIFPLINKVKVTKQMPDWDLITKNISIKYPTYKSTSIILELKSDYVKNVIGDWEAYAKIRTQILFSYQPKKDEEFSSWLKTNGMAWEVFRRTDNKFALNEALKWIEMGIGFFPKGNHLQDLDTKANILYKLGRNDEALLTEQNAIAKAKEMKQEGLAAEYANVLEKMKVGQPTWPQIKNDNN